MMSYLSWIVMAFAFWEGLLVGIYNAILKVNPAWTLGVILGSKLLKVMVVVAVILAVKYLSDIPVKPFALALLGGYVVSIVFETIYFLYKKKQNENK